MFIVNQDLSIPDNHHLATIDGIHSGAVEVLENLLLNVAGVYTIMISDNANNVDGYLLIMGLP